MAFSIITWDRLEPLDQTSDLRVALGAPIADPLWLLHRQWQLGELDGNDAGTPIAVTVADDGDAAVALPRRRRRPPSDWSPADTPLEPLVEAERVRGLPEQHRRLAAETGAQFVRMLTVAGQPTVVPAVRQRFALLLAAIPDARADPVGAEAAVLLAGRAVDGDALAAALASGPGRRWSAAVGAGGVPRRRRRAPGRPAVVGVVRRARRRATDPVRTGDRARRRRPGTRGASSTGSRRRPATTTFVASAFDDGHLDWPDLDVDDRVDLGGAAPAPAESTAVAIPVPLTYPGMPAHRYWEIEDGRVDFGALQAGSTDIVRMLLTDFALVYGEDWFLVPIERAGRLGRAHHVDGGARHVRRRQHRHADGRRGRRARPSTGRGRCTARPPRRAPALGLDVLFVPPSLAGDAGADRRSRRWPSSATRWPTWCGRSNVRCRARSARRSTATARASRPPR